MKKFRVGCVGNGGMGTGHLEAYVKEADRVEIVALCDIVPAKMEKAKKKFGLDDVKCYTDYKEMIDQEDLDFVDICTPNYLHSIIAVDAFAAGKHVFCEKPDAINVEEVLKMDAAAKKAGRIFSARFAKYCPVV